MSYFDGWSGTVLQVNSILVLGSDEEMLVLNSVNSMQISLCFVPSAYVCSGNAHLFWF